MLPSSIFGRRIHFRAQYKAGVSHPLSLPYRSTAHGSPLA